MSKFIPGKGQKKECEVCGKIFEKKPKETHQYFSTKKVCSMKCRSVYMKGVKPWNKGLKGTQESNSGSFKKGERVSPKTEFDGSYNGEKHWNWKGGVTDENQKLRTSSEYKKWRKAVFEKDNYTCTWCGKKSGDGKRVILNADHIKPFSMFPDLRLDVSNGRTLCEDCHKFTASYMGRLNYFNKKLKKFIPGKTRIEYGGAILSAEDFDAVMQTMFSQGGKRWTVGPESVSFEEELARNTGVERAVVVNSGSSALLLAISALKLEPGSLVAIPAVNFPTAFNAIIQCGLVPYVVDVDPETLLIDFDELAKNKHISAVIAVNIASNPVDLVKLREVVGENVKIILDNCDGYGTKIHGRYVDALADLSCVSFHAAHIITTGEGGAVLTNDSKLADTVKKLREWGRADGTDELYVYEGLPADYRSRYVYEEIGYNLKPLELQCAMGRVQLKKIDYMSERRKENFNNLYDRLSKYPDLQLIKFLEYADVCWFSFPMLVKNGRRGELMKYLEKNNIECRTIFSGNILKHPAYKNTKYVPSGTMKNADMVMRDGMFLSVHPSITDEMIEYIDQTIGEIFEKNE